MKDIMRQACYSFLCQRILLIESDSFKDGFSLPFGPEGDKFDKNTYSFLLNSIIKGTVKGVNLFMDSPEKIAVGDFENRMIREENRSGLKLRLPPSFPFELLNLWFTPQIFNPDTEKTDTGFHFIHAQKLNTNSFNLVYVVCEKLKEVNWDEPNIEWTIKPLSFIMTINESIMKTPLLPLSKIQDLYNIQLRKKIIDIKSGRESDTNMVFYSLLNEDLPKKTQDYYMKTYMIPGIFIFFFGFLEKFANGKLQQVPEVIDPIELEGQEMVPQIKFQNVSLK